MTNRYPLTELKEAISSALSAAQANEMQQLVTALSDADSAFEETFRDGGEDALEEYITHIVLPGLLAEPVFYARFNFAASLAQPGSHGPFFQAVQKQLSYSEDTLSMEQLMGLVESFRRTEQYFQMNRFVRHLTDRLQGDQSVAAWGTRAKISYEMHMARYQEAEKSTEHPAQISLYKQSLALAEQSAEEADLAFDAPGRLYAQMNIGELQYKLGNTISSIDLLEKVASETEDLLKGDISDADARNRISRITMSTYRILLQVCIKLEIGVEPVQSYLDKLEANPVFIASKGQGGWVDTLPEQARQYINAKS